MSFDMLSEEVVMTLAKLGINPLLNYPNIPRLPTGSLTLDHAISGGWPMGRWLMLWGEFSSGKTTTLLVSAAKAQELYPDKYVGFIDTEHALDPIWVKNLGVDMQRFVLVRPNTTEQAHNQCRAMIKSGLFSLIGFDSIGMVASAAEVAGDIGDNTVANNARLNKDFFTRVTPELTESGTVVVLTNHITYKIGGNGDPENMPGGQKVKYAPSIIVKMYKPVGNQIMIKGEDVTGVVHRGKIIKNKVGPPMRSFSFLVRQGEFFGVDPVDEAATLSFKLGVFQKQDGAVFEGSGNPYFGGEPLDINSVNVPASVKKDKTLYKVKMLLYGDHDLFYKVEAAVREAISGGMYKPDLDDFYDDAEAEDTFFDEQLDPSDTGEIIREG
jgi:recombination protein RecA